MPRTWHKARLIHWEQAGPRVRRFWIQAHHLDSFDYQAGQFITFDLPTGEKRIDRWRSYSIASIPDGSNVIELAILYMPGGKASEYFFHELKPGDELSFRGPVGAFTFDASPSYHRHVMICTGTGVVPYRSMIHLGLQQTDKRFHLIYGTRHASEILYLDEWQWLSEVYPERFQLDVCLSREENEAYRHGYVHQVYETHYLQPAPDRLFYLCGWSEMIDQAQKKLETLGNSLAQIRVELYG